MNETPEYQLEELARDAAKVRETGNRLTMSECQKLYDKYEIQSFEHTGITTDLCMVIESLEKQISDACMLPEEVIRKMRKQS